METDQARVILFRLCQLRERPSHTPIAKQVGHCWAPFRQYTLALALLCILAYMQLIAQPAQNSYQNHSIRNLAADDGLSSNMILSIVQDTEGFMWFATPDGLNRFDGYSVEIYRSDPQDRNSLPINALNSLTESRNGEYLWVGTEGGGLVRLEKRTRTFTRFTSDSHVLDYNVVQHIFEDDDGTLWLATNGSMLVLRISGDSIQSARSLVVEPPRSSRLWRNFFAMSHKDKFGRLWFATWGGLYFFDREHGSLERSQATPHVDSITTITEDGDGTLWFGTMHRGMYRVDAARGKTIHVADTGQVLASYAVDTTTVWFSTRSGELFSIDTRTNVCTPILLDGKSVGRILTLFKDRTGSNWLGTEDEGLFTLFPSREITTYKNVTDDHPGANSVWSLCETRDGTLWVGTSNGVKILDRSSRQLRDTPLTHLKNHQVRAILEDGDAMWFGLLEDGLWKWEQGRNRWKHFIHNPKDSNSIQVINVYALHRDRRGVLWIGSNDGGLTRFNPVSEVFKNYKPKSYWVTAIHEDDLGHLWLGTWAYGLCRFDPDAETFEYFSLISTRPNIIAANSVLAIHASRSQPGVLWLAMNGSGLVCFDTKSRQQTAYTTVDGLPNNFVYGIVEDTLGNLWVSSNAGVSQFNPEPKSFRNFTAIDGLQGNQFNMGAAMLSTRKEIFFGGQYGLNSFVARRRPNSLPPQVSIKSVTVSGEAMNFAEDGSQDEKLVLPHDATDIAIEFVGLHYDEPTKNKYAYQMLGLDSSWIPADDERKAVFATLVPGEYVFSVKVANSDGVWSEPRVLLITVLRPIWQRWWFLFTAAVLLFALAMVFYRSQINRVKEIERARVLEEQRIRSELKIDMHDSFAGVIAKMSGLASDLREENDLSDEETKERLERIADYSAALQQSYSAIQWGYDQHKESLFDLMDQLKQYGETLFARSGAKFHLATGMQSFINIKLPMECRKELLLLFCEAMNNSAKHSDGSSEITLSAKVENETLKVCLQDNGHGFDEDKSGRKNGLIHMRKRAAKLNGTLDIESANGSGVKITFIGKLHRGIV